MNAKLACLSHARASIGDVGTSIGSCLLLREGELAVLEVNHDRVP